MKIIDNMILYHRCSIYDFKVLEDFDEYKKDVEVYISY